MSSKHLRNVAMVFGFVVAALHLFHPGHGVAKLAAIAVVDPSLLVAHPRPLAFVLSGLALLVGVNLLLVWDRPTFLYAGGMGLAVTYLVGYFAWHLSGHGGFLPGREPIYHGLAPHEAVVAHLSTDLWAAAAVLSEIALFLVLLALYRRAR